MIVYDLLGATEKIEHTAGASRTLCHRLRTPALIDPCQLDASCVPEHATSATGQAPAYACDQPARMPNLEQEQPSPHLDPCVVEESHTRPRRVTCPMRIGMMYYTNTPQETTNDATRKGRNERNSGERFRGIDLPVRFGRPFVGGTRS